MVGRLKITLHQNSIIIKHKLGTLIGQLGGGTRVQTPVILRVGLSTEIANERQLGEAVAGCCHVFVGFTGYLGSPN